MNKCKYLFVIIALPALLLVQGCKDKEPEPSPVDPPFYRLNNVGPHNLETDNNLDQVNMIFQVLDKNYRGVIGMHDVGLYELVDFQDDMTQSPEADVRIDTFGTIPITVYTVLLLDLSKSVEGLVPQIKQAALTFVQNSLDAQQIAIYTFDGDEPKLRIDYTANRNLLSAAINSLPETALGSSTNLYESIITAVAKLPNEEYSLDGIVQCNIMLFTDGKEEASPQNKQQALLAAEKYTVFVAALQSPSLDETTLIQLAGSGNYFKADNAEQLEARFAEIQRDISLLSRSVYRLYYTSPRKGATNWNIRLNLRSNSNTGLDRYAEGTYNSQGF